MRPAWQDETTTPWPRAGRLLHAILDDCDQVDEDLRMPRRLAVESVRISTVNRYDNLAGGTELFGIVATSITGRRVVFWVVESEIELSIDWADYETVSFYHQEAFTSGVTARAWFDEICDVLKRRVP